MVVLIPTCGVGIRIADYADLTDFGQKDNKVQGLSNHEGTRIGTKGTTDCAD